MSFTLFPALCLLASLAFVQSYAVSANLTDATKRLAAQPSSLKATMSETGVSVVASADFEGIYGGNGIQNYRYPCKTCNPNGHKTGAMGPWTLTGNAYIVNRKYSDFPIKFGKGYPGIPDYACLIETGTTATSIYQNFANLVIGGSYRVSFYYALRDTSGFETQKRTPLSVKVFMFSDEVYSKVPSTVDWVKVSTDSVISVGSHITIRFEVIGTGSVPGDVGFIGAVLEKVEPSVAPTTAPTMVPTSNPAVPTAVPTSTPTAIPTSIPTAVPTSAPTSVPTSTPTAVPTSTPTVVPTSIPTAVPTSAPTAVPTSTPTAVPTSATPTAVPSATPTAMPSYVSDIGACKKYAIFGSSTVTFDGAQSTVPHGNVGVSPGTSITVATGTLQEVLKHGKEEVNTLDTRECAKQHLAVIYSAYDATCGKSDISVLDGLTLYPGIYCFETFSLSAGATVTLDGTKGGGKWVFVAGSTFITGANAKVIIKGGLASNVLWVLGTSATIGAYTEMKGSIMASAAITLNTGATVDGHAVAGTAVTCASNCNVSF